MNVSLLEVAAFYGIVFSTIWLGQEVPFRPPLLVAGLLLVGVCFFSNRKHGDSREKIGLDPHWLKPCARLVFKTLGLPLLVLVVWALTKPVPPWPKILFGVLGYPLWAFAQEYALLSFLANRLRDGLGERPWLVSAANAVLFSLIHLPNPMLMLVCLFGGFAFTRIFLKTPHLIPLALAHAAAGFALSVIFQDFYPAMMVGPAYLRYR
jgi:hypothetical protein